MRHITLLNFAPTFIPFKSTDCQIPKVATDSDYRNIIYNYE